MKINKHTIITYLIFVVFFLLDQFSKQYVINTMPINIDTINHTFSQYEPYKLFDWFWIYHVVNFGAAFSIFYGNVSLLIVLVTLITVALIIFERRSLGIRTYTFSIGLGLILSGALGNLTDRIRMGYVTDFFALMNNGKLLWPVFNVADIAVNCGVAFLLFFIIFQEKNISKSKAIKAQESIN